MLRRVAGVLVLLGVIGAVLPAHAGRTAGEAAAIDAHALAAPEWVTTSPSCLSSYLVAPARDDREKARAIFRWIAANVTYDASLWPDSRDPKVVLSRRRAVCLGYAVLFKALAEEAGMRAEIVIGHSKTLKPGAPEETDGRPNHAWNAVEIDGRWRLVDCCFGAGHRDESGQFVHSFCSHYFLTAPEMFVYDHFPADPRWQLLEAPISKGDYLKRAHVQPPFFECGLRQVSHPLGMIDADESVAVTLGAPAEAVLVAVLYRDGKEVEGGRTFTQGDAEGFVIRAQFPSPGTYVLRIFARRRDAPGNEYDWALDYTVHARTGGQGGSGFPKTYGSFLTRNCRLEQGLSRTLPAGEAVELSLTVPSAEDVVVATGGALERLPGEGSRFAGRVAVAPGPLVVFAKFAGRPNYEGLLQYEGQ